MQMLVRKFKLRAAVEKIPLVWDFLLGLAELLKIDLKFSSQEKIKEQIVETVSAETVSDSDARDEPVSDKKEIVKSHPTMEM